MLRVAVVTRDNCAAVITIRVTPLEIRYIKETGDVIDRHSFFTAVVHFSVRIGVILDFIFVGKFQ